jgi:hypothetical protein
VCRGRGTCLKGKKCSLWLKNTDQREVSSHKFYPKLSKFSKMLNYFVHKNLSSEKGSVLPGLEVGLLLI